MGSRQNEIMQSMLLYVDCGQDPCLTTPAPPPQPPKKERKCWAHFVLPL